MREILFRGKRVDNGEWVYGSLIVDYSDRCFIFESSRFLDFKQHYIAEYFIEVIPDTIGQFTGLTDKNGTRIFEGDKVKFIDIISTTIPFTESVNEVFWWNEFSCFSLKNTESDLTFLTHCEVIGNIHDKQQEEKK